MKRRRLLIGLLTGLGAILALPGPARGALILDDFDDPATVESPSMLNQNVVTENVGDLLAQRRVRIAGLQAAPTGRLDVDAEGNSLLAASLGALNPGQPQSSKFVSVQSDYFFPQPTDVTEGGRNNAILYDFRRLTSAIRPRFLRIIVFDPNNSYEASVAPVAPREGPFTLVMPFDSFTIRGGAPGLPDFTKLRFGYVTLRVVGGGGPADLQFHMELERIRFGRIPEPSAAALAALGGIGLWEARRRSL